MNTAPNSPWKGFHPNVTPFGNSPRYDRSVMESLYKKSTDEVVSTLKPIDEEKATLEAEQGEIVAQYKEGGLSFHDVKGTRHSKKGTPLNLEDGAFIYSRFNKMKLTPEELDTFKLGGSVKSKDGNTPAFVLKRNIDIEHNNDLLTKLTDSKNPAEKNTARLMLQKYQQIAGKVAALQEIRKPNPNIPTFGNLTPSSDMPEAIEKQYAKLGGFVLPQAKEGLYTSKYDLNTWQGNKNSLGKKTASEFTLQEWDEVANRLGFKGKGNKEFEEFLLNNPEAKKVIDSRHQSLYGKNAYMDPGHFGAGWAAPELKTLESNPLIQPSSGQSAFSGITNKFNFSNTATEPEYTAPQREDLAENEYYKQLLARPYDYTSMHVNNINSIAQGYLNKKYTPGLALPTPLRVREQQFDAQPSVNNALSNYYTAGKLNNQYVRPGDQNMQLAYTEALKNAQGIQSQYDKMNQEQSTNVHNQNATSANNAINQTSQAFAQYQDKVNERDQYVDDTRREASANVLQNIGNSYASATQYNMNKDLMRVMQPWKVNQLSQDNKEAFYSELSKMQSTPGYKAGDSRTQTFMLKYLLDKYSPKNQQARQFSAEDGLRMLYNGVN